MLVVVVVVGSETDTVGDAVSPSSDAVVSGAGATLVVVVGTPVLVDATLSVLVTSGAGVCAVMLPVPDAVLVALGSTVVDTGVVVKLVVENVVVV